MINTTSAVTGANVRAEMARRGLAQAALAERIGMTQSALSKRLRGVIAFDINELGLIARELDVSLGDLLPAPEAQP